MRAYTKQLSEVVAGFPGAVYVPPDRRDRSNDLAAAVETGVVPGAGNGYSVILNYGVLKQAELVVTDTTSGVVLTAVPWELVPGADEVGVKFDAGYLRFHASRSGHDISVGYTPLGSVATSDYENRLGKELAAAQTSLAAILAGTATLNASVITTGNLGVGRLPTGGTWSMVSGLVLALTGGPTTLSVGAPTTGVDRVTLELAAPTGGTTNYSLKALGDVLLGPSAQLHVDGGTYARAGNPPIQRLFDTAYAYLFGGNASTSVPTAHYHMYAQGSVLQQRSNMPFTWQVAGTQRWRVDANGVAVNGRGAANSTTPPSAGAYWQTPSLATAIVSKTANYTATDADSTILVDATAGAVTITLPNPAAGNNGQRWRVKKVDASANAVTVVCANGTSLIDGATSFVVGAQWARVHLQSNGTGYWVI